jgi:cold shock protein
MTMSSERGSAPQAVFRANATGMVKWFNPTKGFGFVTFDDGSPDAFCHISVVEEAGHDTLSEGATIACDLSQGQRGPQVAAIHSVDASTATPSQPSRRPDGRARLGLFKKPQSARRQNCGERVSGEVEGTVKFFNTSKGFGFIAPDSGGKDVFVHIRALSRSGLQGLDEGQRVRVTIREDDRGPSADRIELI